MYQFNDTNIIVEYGKSHNMSINNKIVSVHVAKCEFELNRPEKLGDSCIVYLPSSCSNGCAISSGDRPHAQIKCWRASIMM